MTKRYLIPDIQIHAYFYKITISKLTGTVTNKNKV